MGDVPPRNNMEAEQSLLGAVLIDQNAAAVAMAIVQPDDCYRQVHQAILRAAYDLHGQGEPVDQITLTEYLMRRGELDQCGGVAYLTTLSCSVPSASNVSRYAEIVADCAKARRVRELCLAMAERCDDGTVSGQDLEAELVQRADSLMHLGSLGGFRPMSDVIRDLNAKIGKDGDHHMFPTGIGAIDANLDGGLRPGTMAVVAGWPGMGKTTLALGILSGQHPQTVTAITSLEMTPDDLVGTLVAQRTNIAVRRVRQAIGRSGILRPDEESEVGMACAYWYERQWWIGSPEETDVDGLIAQARALHLRHGLGLWMVDHCHELTSRTHASRGKTHELDYCVRRLGQFARSTGACVLLLSQCRKRPTLSKGAPTMHDLKETSSLQEVPSAALILHRESDLEGGEDEITLELAKNRFGPRVTAKLAFDERKQVFRQLETRLHEA